MTSRSGLTQDTGSTVRRCLTRARRRHTHELFTAALRRWPV
jgi:hypothetical protein